MNDIEEIIEEFNDGNWSRISKIFNNKIEVFLNFILRKGLIDELDLSNIPYDNTPSFEYLVKTKILDKFEYKDIPEILENDFLLYKIQQDPETWLEWISGNLLTDVEKRSDGYYLFLRDRQELAELFDDRIRNTTAKEVAERVLDEDYYEDFYDSTDDVYRDVIDELDPENILKLKNHIFREIGNVELSLENYDSEFFEGLSEEQGTEGYFIIKETDLDELIKNEEAMKQFLDDDLYELKSELHNIHNNAYNGAYQSELYSLIWSELDRYFVGRIIDQQIQSGEKIKWLQYVKIRDFKGNVTKFLSNRLGSEYNEDKLDYYGSYTGMMKQLMDDDEYDWLDFRIPDYPDYSLVNKDINDIFGDYI
jgi:hypothetical protein